MSPSRLPLLLLLTLLLGACGFHLRGSDTLPPTMQPLHVSGAEAGGAFGKVLQQQLNLRGVEVSRHRVEAPYQLLLLKHEREERTLSLDPRAHTGELALTERVVFELRDRQGSLVLGPVTVEERRVMVDDPDRRVDKDAEASTLRDEMLSGLAGQLLRRLQAWQPPAAAAD